MRCRFFKNELGQTVSEYMLLIAVSAMLGIAFMKKMDEYLINNPNGLIGKPLKEFKNKLNQDTDGRYKVYPIGPMMK
jgi:Flp pilus assembly pilin Flp